MIQDNIKYPSHQSKSKTKANESVLDNKVIERAISNLFKYLKSILPKETYTNVKVMFIEEIYKGTTGTLTQDDSFSSIIKIINQPAPIVNSGINHSRHVNAHQEEMPAKNLKLSYDFLPIARDNNNNNSNYNSHSINKQSEIYKSQASLKGTCAASNNKVNYHHHYHNPLSHKNYNLFDDKKHSLYSLTKNSAAVINKTRSNSKSQSNSREHSSVVVHKRGSGVSSNISFAKVAILTNNSSNQYNHLQHKTIQMNINTTSNSNSNSNSNQNYNNNNRRQPSRINTTTTTTVNENNSKNAIKKSIITKTQNLLNTNLFSKLQNDLIKMESIKNCFIEKKIIPNPNNGKENNVNKSKSRVDNKKKLQSYRSEKELSREKDKDKKHNNKNSAINLGIRSDISYNQTKTIYSNKEDENNGTIDNTVNGVQGSNNNKRDMNDLANETNEIRNSEQLKKIKSSLDDNLKVMFNFSYDCFLNRESESESKRSYEDSAKRGDNKKLTYSYKKKYKY